ncbi:MAG: hypothetical protein U0797_08515 [Gemmataceae bacterium]
MHRWFRAGAPLALAVGLLLGLSPARGDDPASLIARIQKVGREGAGNEDAATAWKALVKQGPAALAPILGAINDDQFVAANWLRPAFEAVAEKALADGKLSRDALDKFVADKKLAGSARALAYEWLVRVDKGASERLLPTMLQDPSAELRRLAVERVVKQAEALEKADKKAPARAAYEKALAGACDPDQVDAIAKALEKLGAKVDLARHYGVVQKWHLITPFDHKKGAGWDVTYPPEKGIDLTASYKGTDGKEAKWVEHTTTDATGVVDLNKALGKLKGTIAYAGAFVESPTEREVELRVGCINGLKVWLNGKLLFANEEYHHGMRMDQYVARGTLKKGANTILLKVAQNEQKENWAQEWRFQLRLCDRVGAAVPFTPSKPGAQEDK